MVRMRFSEVATLDSVYLYPLLNSVLHSHEGQHMRLSVSWHTLLRAHCG